MASNSTKSKNSSKELTLTKSPVSLQTDDDESDDSDENTDPFRLYFDFLHGIKSLELWKKLSLNRTKSTYFILPEPPSDYEVLVDYVWDGFIKPTRGDFAKFWLDELCDLHKDRYLLVTYLAVYNAEIRTIDEIGGPDAFQVKVLWNEKLSQMSQLLRGFVMEKNKNKFRRGDALTLFVNGSSVADVVDILSRPQLAPLKQMIDLRLDLMRPRMNPFTEDVFSRHWGTSVGLLLSRVLSGFVNTYFVWVSYDSQNLRRYANELERMGKSVVPLLHGDSRLNGQINFMRKLKLAAPRWSELDRRIILDAIETEGKSCRGTYVQVLLNEVGVEKFKKLVFGKQHFCGHCRRSSYTGEDRMLACKRCDTEGVRPRAWYCDRDCQKANWRKHKASKHPTIVVEEKASVNPTADVEKKAGKKKKRKPRKK